MIPVYRLSEGKDTLHLNEYAFRRTKEILAANGTVLVFIEGICVNSHDLQPFKKGAARIAAENAALPGFAVMPVGIAYDHLQGTGKTVQLQAADPIPVMQLLPYLNEAQNRTYFNQNMLRQLNELVCIPKPRSENMALKCALFLPALAGYLLHILPYRLLCLFVYHKTNGTVFYDSVLFALLFIFYPCILFLSGMLIWFVYASPVLVILLWTLLPFSAWSATRVWN